MSIPQFTTPTFVFIFTEQDLDLTQARNVYVTFSGPGYELTKTGNDLTVEQKSISVWLSQNETSRMKIGAIEIQANWTTPNGNRAAGDVVTVEISKQLLRKVVE